MSALTEAAAELLLFRRALIPARPGLVGARIGIAHTTGLSDGRHRLRHGHLDVLAGRATLSVPPSPGVDVAIRRAADDLATARKIAPADDDKPIRTTAVRVSLEAGIAGNGLLGYRHRWNLAHTVGPVLHAVFGTPGTAVPPPTGPEPRTTWAAYVLDAPRSDGRTFRAWTRSTDRPTRADLDQHLKTLALPVQAHGHLSIDAAGDLPGELWATAMAVTAVLLDDPRAAAQASDATWLLARPGVPSPWIRAAHAGLVDEELATAARVCLFAAYDALTRHGVARDLRDAVAALAAGDTNARRTAV